MTLKDLLFIRSITAVHLPSTKDKVEVIRILDREIKLKTMDPRKPKDENTNSNS
jgi:hypothetical protein